jgi:transposase
MTTLATTPPAGTGPRRYAPAPWHDDHPQRLALEQRLGPDPLARRIDRAVTAADLRALEAAYGRTGSLPHDPACLLRVVLFEIERGQHSPATRWRDSQESDPVRWRLRGRTPARSCWYAFRDRVGPVLEELNRQVLHQAVAEGLTPADRGALDGTLVAANASRHRLVNQATLSKRAAQLAAVAAAAVPPAALAPLPPVGGAAAAPPPALAPLPPVGGAAAVPPPWPKDPPGWMATTPTGRQQQRQRLQQAQADLAARLQRNQAKPADKRAPPDKLVISVSDPEAALGRDKQGVFRPLYNVQLIDDLDSPFILSYGVFAQTNDAGLWPALLQRHLISVGQRLRQLLADSAYAGGPDLAAADAARVTVYAPWQSNDYRTAAERSGKQLPKSAFPWQAEAGT